MNIMKQLNYNDAEKPKKIYLANIFTQQLKSSYIGALKTCLDIFN